MSARPVLALRVLAVDALTERVSSLVLGALDGSVLPDAEPGAHIELALRGVRSDHDAGVAHRAYSLVSPAPAPRYYEIAVQREPQGSGGSMAMHRLKVGDTIEARAPANDFPLDAAARHSVLIAGGIGITPILSMARQLHATGRPFRLEYLTRGRAATAYAEAVEALGCSRLWHDGGATDRQADAAQLLGPYADGHHAYVCGPKPLVAAVVAAGDALGWPRSAVHYELFAGELGHAADRTFRVRVAGTDSSYEVRPGQSVLDVLEQAGLPILSDCRRGECGVCITPVLAGMPDHRDTSLTASERIEGKLFCPCVSRALSEEIVVQLP